MSNKVFSFLGNVIYNRYFGNTIWLLLEKVLRLFISIFIGVWLARYLGPNTFGEYSYVVAFVAILSIFIPLGLDNIVIRELVKQKTDKNVLLGTVFTLRLLATCLFFIVITSISFIIHDQTTSYYILISSIGLFLQLFTIVDFYFRATVQSKYIVFCNITSLVISAIIKCILILYSAPLIAFFYASLFDGLIITSSYIFVYINKGNSISKWCFDKQLAKHLLRQSWPLLLTGLTANIYIYADRLIISYMLDFTSVGIYTAATKIGEAWYFIPQTIIASLFPAIINAKEVSNELFYQRLQKLCQVVAWLSILVAITITPLANYIIHLIYGNAYQGAAHILTVYIWTGLFISLGNIQSSFWIVCELQKQQFYIMLLCAILNIILNIIFIHLFGIIGSAYATLLAQFISVMLLPLFIPRARHMMKTMYCSLFFIKKHS